MQWYVRGGPGELDPASEARLVDDSGIAHRLKKNQNNSTQSFLFTAHYHDPEGNQINLKAWFLRDREITSQLVQVPHCCSWWYQIHSPVTSKLSRLRWTCKPRWLRWCSAGHVTRSFLLKYSVRVSWASAWKQLLCGTRQVISVMLLLGRRAKNTVHW